MQKKLLLWGILLICVIAVIVCFFVFKSRNDVAILDGIKYGMSPGEIERKLGHPTEKEFYEVDNSVSYYYSGVVNNEPASIYLHFYRSFLRWRLYDVRIVFESTPEMSAEEFSKAMVEKIRTAYAGEESYYEDIEGTQAKLGVNYGATGIFYTIEYSKDKATIDGVKLE